MDSGLDSIIDFTESRKARTERGELFRQAAKDLMLLLERQRQQISEEFMTFLLALAVSDQALYYADQAEDKRAGHDFLDELANNARQIFETHYMKDDRPARRPLRPVSGRIVEFARTAQQQQTLD